MKIRIVVIVFFLIIILSLFESKADDKLNHIQILLNKKNYLILNSLISENKKNKIIFPNYKKKLKAKVMIDDKIYPARIWLDGLSEEHYDSHNITNNSFEIRIKQKNYILNTRKFRVLSKKAFRYDFPISYNQILKYYNLPYRNIIPINFSIKHQKNTKKFNNKEIYLLEEKIGEDFLDKNYLRQSVIFERDLHDNNEFIKTIFEQRNNLITKDEANLKKSEIFLQRKNETKIILKQNERMNLYALKLFNEYLKNQKNPNEVFDINQISKIFAIHSVTNMFHALSDINVKFYFDPITKKILLIPTDPHIPLKLSEKEKNYFLNGNLIKYLTNQKYFSKGVWYENLIKDEYFIKSYLLHLEKITHDKNFLIFLKKLNYTFSAEGHTRSIKIILRNIDFYKKFFQNRDNIAKKQFKIKEKKVLDNKYFSYDHVNKKIFFKSKYVYEPIMISKNFNDYELILDKDDLIFEKYGSLVINSNFKCNNESKTINIISNSDYSFIYFFGEITNIDNCNFKNFSHNLSKEFSTSPITFFNTNLTINNSLFENSRSEDLVNIVNTYAKISNSHFNNAQSDVIDIDNSKGILENLKISNCKNDCLDFSSSKFKIKNLKVKNAGDKGISIGENSSIDLDGSTIDECNSICIAIKDSSRVTLKNVNFVNGEIAIAQYIKKKIFNEPNVKFNENINYEKIKKPFIKAENLEEVMNN
jgi:hypothetical protein